MKRWAFYILWVVGTVICSKDGFSQISSSLQKGAKSGQLTRMQMQQQRLFLRADSSKMHHAIYPLIGWQAQTEDEIEFLPFELRWRLNQKATKKAPISLQIHPLVTLQQGIELQNSDPSGFNQMGIGGHLDFSVGTRFYLELNYQETNAQLNAFERNFADNREVIPGQGYAYGVEDRFFFRDLNGYAAYRPSNHFHLQLGRGKNFIGDGYRSLLLSDAGYNYDYFKLTTDFWKVRLVNLFNHMTDVRFSDGEISAFTEKYSAIHYLSIQPTQRWNIGLFEAVVWQAHDGNSHRGFDVNYLNPIVFYRPIEFSVGSPDNVLVGLNNSVLLSKNVKVYSQFLLDEFKISELRSREGWWANKYSLQLGGYWFNAFNQEHLTLQAEYNLVRPFTYSHGNVLLNYGQFNQPLAHPLGANFQEAVAIANYTTQKWMVELKSTLALVGTETTSDTISSGTDIFKSYVLRERDYNYRLPGLSDEKLFTAELRVNYLISKAVNLQIELRCGYRKDTRKDFGDLAYGVLGVRTGIFNRYNDY